MALHDGAQQDGLSRRYIHASKISRAVPPDPVFERCLQRGTFHVHVTTAISLSELVLQGEHDDHPHFPTRRTRGSALEWLGLAVGEMPYLISSARTVDDINWRSTAPHAARMHIGLIDALAQHIASSAALLHGALVAHYEAHPVLGEPERVLEDVDFLSHALVEDHPPLWRRSELMEGGYVTALAAAVQASGCLCDARVAGATGEGSPPAEAAATVVGDAISRALATLLGHARLNARDRGVVEQRAS